MGCQVFTPVWGTFRGVTFGGNLCLRSFGGRILRGVRFFLGYTRKLLAGACGRERSGAIRPTSIGFNQHILVYCQIFPITKNSKLTKKFPSKRVWIAKGKICCFPTKFFLTGKPVVFFGSNFKRPIKKTKKRNGSLWRPWNDFKLEFV